MQNQREDFMKLFLLSLSFYLAFAVPQSSMADGKPFDYPLSSCLTCGDVLGDATVIMTHAGRELKFCCLECVGTYTKSPETYISNLEEQIKISQRANYPLTVCPVSGHELGSMGDPVEYVSGNTLVKFCCGACIEKFENDRDQFLKKLNDARK